MDRLSYSSFGVARFMMAFAVFFCHVFEKFNDFGFLFVGVFFFMSGYGMEKSSRRDQALLRLIPYLLFFVWYSFLYLFVFRVFIYPSSWFLVVYFLIMVLYRFIPNIYGLLWSFVALACMFVLLDFSWGWSASYGAFLFGVFFARNSSSFTFKICLCFLPLSILLFVGAVPALWCILPLFSYVVLSVSSLPIFRPLVYLGRYSYHFYCVHCFALGVFGVTWTLGGSPEFWGVLLAFSLSVFLSLFFKDYLFKYPKVS